MTKAQLIDAVAKKTGFKKKDAEAAVSAAFDAMTEALTEGEKVQIVGFGTFESKARAAREGKNPQTGEVIKIAACKVPAFKAGKAFKDMLK